MIHGWVSPKDVPVQLVDVVLVHSRVDDEVSHEARTWEKAWRLWRAGRSSSSTRCKKKGRHCTVVLCASWERACTTGADSTAEQSGGRGREVQHELTPKEARLCVQCSVVSFDAVTGLVSMKHRGREMSVDTSRSAGAPVLPENVYHFIGEIDCASSSNAPVLRARVSCNVTGLDTQLYEHSVEERRKFEREFGLTTTNTGTQ